MMSNIKCVSMTVFELRGLKVLHVKDHLSVKFKNVTQADTFHICLPQV